MNKIKRKIVTSHAWKNKISIAKFLDPKWLATCLPAKNNNVLFSFLLFPFLRKYVLTALFITLLKAQIIKNSRFEKLDNKKIIH